VGVHASIVGRIILGFLLYLQVSGQFHIIVGMLKLFGYDLPETNRKYLLSHSISDLWRRINIYWKDFMVKICYLPTYFKLRRKGELRAQLVATTLVFLVTWVLHAYQFFWLQGKFRMTVNDTLFWAVLGALVVANVCI
jgi:D-alanyl-lipoteichoic acid acyltransferase DltB (MBOAT superfamily)